MMSFFQRLPLLVGLALGLLGGLIYTWAVAPVELIDVGPEMMHPDYRQEWVRLAALSYIADGDLERARWRLTGIPREDIAAGIEALIGEYAAAGRSADTMRRLTVLAQALGVQIPAMLVYLDTPAAPVSLTSTPVPTPVPTLVDATPTVISTAVPTLKPTRTPYPPTATPEPFAPFQLATKEQICNPEQTPHIEVVVQDENGTGLPGVEVWLMWTDGADRAVTGLKPSRGLGYVDFDVEEGVEYSLGTSELGAPLVSGLQLEACPEEKGKDPVIGSWRIVLERRPLVTSTPTVTPEGGGGE
ncbi:MAG: hypothetical protein ACK2US_01630 [Anaerolineae bacterium]|jgi:hypothetical protein